MPVCLVCGYPHLLEPPRGASGGGSYEICPSCGFQFGVDDDDRGLDYKTARERWRAKGAPWYSRRITPPPGWQAEAQMRHLLEADEPQLPRAEGER